MPAYFSGELLETLSLMRNSLFLGALLGAVCPLVGVYFVLRRILFLGVTLPQVSAAGVALALLVQSMGWLGVAAVDPHTHGTVPLAGAALVTVLAILVVVRFDRLGKGEAAIGMMYAIAAAGSVLLVAQLPFAKASMLDLLRGEIIGVSDGEILLTLLAFAAATGALLACRREFLLVAYDRELAISLGKNASLWNFLFYLVAALVISVAVMGAGPITTFGYLVIPPLVGLQLTRGMTRVMILSATFGVVASVVSFFTAYHFDLPLGPTSVAIMGFAYLIAAAVKKTFARRTENP